MSTAALQIPRQRIGDLCREHGIRRLRLFGSVLRDDFRPDSDVDVLVTFAPDAEPGFRDQFAMEDELREIFGREVDFVQKKLIENPFIRRHVLATYQTLYAAA